MLNRPSSLNSGKKIHTEVTEEVSKFLRMAIVIILSGFVYLQSNEVHADEKLEDTGFSGYFWKTCPKVFEKNKKKKKNKLDEYEQRDYQRCLDQPKWKDKEYVLMKVREYGGSLEHAHDKLLDDEEVVWAAVQNEPDALNNASERIKQNRPFVLKTLKISGCAFKSVKKYFGHDREAVLVAVKTYGLALEHASAELQADPEIVSVAVHENEWSIQFASQSLKSNLNLGLVVVRKNFSLRKYLDKSIRNHKSILALYYGPEKPDQLARLSADLDALNIEFIERFGNNISVIQEIINNRKNLDKQDPRPLAVVIFPKVDNSGAFNENSIGDLTQIGHRVVYYEAGTDQDVYKDLKAATKDVGKKSDFLMLGGHGARDLISMGAADPAHQRVDHEELYIDLSDKEEMMDLKDCMSENSIVLLMSCSTGEGGFEARNIANMIGSVFPQSKIIAPRVPAHAKVKFNTGLNNRITGVQFIAYRWREGNVIVDDAGYCIPPGGFSKSMKHQRYGGGKDYCK
jgi:hypothetical protein